LGQIAPIKTEIDFRKAGHLPIIGYISKIGLVGCQSADFLYYKILRQKIKVFCTWGTAETA
jgi:hypothetical protein